jgi:hypothetical protein
LKNPHDSPGIVRSRVGHEIEGGACVGIFVLS